MRVTVYSKSNCPQCVQTYHYLDVLGIEYSTVDLDSSPAERSRLIAAGHRAAPVVECEVGTWSGYQPERIRGLAAPEVKRNVRRRRGREGWAPEGRRT
jgi:glutaredoxin-like protein NrdH